MEARPWKSWNCIVQSGVESHGKLKFCLVVLLLQMTKQGQCKIERILIKQRERHRFWWTPDFVSVELIKVKKKPKMRTFWKWQLNSRSWKTWKNHGKLWNLKSSEDYGPRLWSPHLCPLELCFGMMDLASYIRPIHTRDRSAFEVCVKTSGHEIYFGKKIQQIFRHDCAQLKQKSGFCTN